MTIRVWPIVLPFDKPLTMNEVLRGTTKGARMAHARFAADVRTATAVLVTKTGIPPQDFIHVRLSYRPKDKRRRDADGLVATLKPCLDGIVDAGLIPDDTPQHLDWSAPRIHAPSVDRLPLLWVTITTGVKSPDMLSENVDTPTDHR